MASLVIFLPFCLLKALLSEKLQKNVSAPLPGGFVPGEPGSQWTRYKWRARLYILVKPPYKLHEPVLRDQLLCKETKFICGISQLSCKVY